MGDKYTVHPGELNAGSGHVLGLFDDTKSITQALAGTLGKLAGAAGHPDVEQALAGVATAAEKAMLDTGAALEFIGNNLKSTADEYDRTERGNTKILQQHANGK